MNTTISQWSAEKSAYAGNKWAAQVLIHLYRSMLQLVFNLTYIHTLRRNTQMGVLRAVKKTEQQTGRLARPLTLDYSI